MYCLLPKYRKVKTKRKKGVKEDGSEKLRILGNKRKEGHVGKTPSKDICGYNNTLRIL